MYRLDSDKMVHICKGTCGRMTRPGGYSMEVADIETVPRRKDGLCRDCWREREGARGLTPKEKEAKRQLEAYILRRRIRLGRKRGLEQFRQYPLFGTLDSPAEKNFRSEK